MQKQKNSNGGNMELVVLLFFCFIFYYTGVQGLSVETQNGVAISVTMTPHVYLDNQTDHFRFEVKSCEEVNITFQPEIAFATNVDIKLVLRPGSNLSSYFVCYSQKPGQLQCSGLDSQFATPDFCSEFVAFWVMTPTITRQTIGSGCTVGVDKMSEMSSTALSHGVLKMDLVSKSTAVWKLGHSVCLPPTTRSPPTTPSPSVQATDQSVTTDLTSPNITVTEREHATQKCLPATGSDDRSSFRVIRSATWLLMTSLILDKLL